MSKKKAQDYTGLRIGKTTVLRLANNNIVTVLRTGEEHRPARAWVCRCDCGYEWDVPHSRISAVSPASCNGCADRTHKRKLPRTNLIKEGHPSYGSWYSMIRRCTSPNHENYKRYGGRGITVDPAWLSFDKFVEDMGTRPEGHTIDRKDNDKGYSKDNCRWATPKQQTANRRPKG